MLPRSLVVAAALACLTAGPLAGTASAGWSDPVPISTAGADASSAFTAMNDSGVTVVDWGENYENGGVTRGYIHRPGGPDCSLDSALADLGSGAMVAVTPSGEVALVGAPADYTLSAMVIPPGQCTGAVTTIERSAWPVNDLQVLADGAGGLTAFWERDDTHELRASYRPPGGSWQPPKLAANPDERLTYPHYAVDDDGDALASWMSPGNVYVASRHAGGAFTTKLLRSAYRVSEAEVALDHHGNGLLGWFESDNDSSGDMMLAEWPAGGDLQPPVVLQHGAPINDYPLFAVAPDDEVTMAFVGTDDMALVGRARPGHGVVRLSCADHHTPSAPRVSRADAAPPHPCRRATPRPRARVRAWEHPRARAPRPLPAACRDPAARARRRPPSGRAHRGHDALTQPPLGGSPSVGIPGIACSPRWGTPSPSGSASGGPSGWPSGASSGRPVGTSSLSSGCSMPGDGRTSVGRCPSSRSSPTTATSTSSSASATA